MVSDYNEVKMERIQQALLNINWPVLNLEQTKLAAYSLINQWRMKNKAKKAKETVANMTSAEEIQSYMWNATVRGMRIKYHMGVQKG